MRLVLWIIGLLAAFLAADLAHADTDPTGAYQTTIPIEVPPYHGLEPNLSLIYNSNSGNGWLGVGWNLSGLSSIQRASLGKGVANYDDNDIFYLDGMELIPCTPGMQSPSCQYPASSNYKAYTTKIESFQRIAFDPTTGGGSWYIWNKLGIKIILVPHLTTPSGVFNWHISIIEDTLGQKVSYNYWSDAITNSRGETYLDSITYNGTVVKFYREDRPDIISYANGYDLVTVRYRLKTIDIMVGGTRARSYKLTYTERGDGPSRSLLKEVQLFGRDATLDHSGTITGGTASPAMSFTAQNLVTGEDGALLRWQSKVAPSLSWEPWESTDTTPVFGGKKLQLSDYFLSTLLTGDANGDGRDDWIHMYKPQPDEFPFPDNIQEIRIQTGIVEQLGKLTEAGNSITVPGESSFFRHRAWAADLNGDERTDVIFTLLNVIDHDYIVYLTAALSKGDGHYEIVNFPPQATTWQDHRVNSLQISCQPGDVDGDRKSDLLCLFIRDDKAFIGRAFLKDNGTFQITDEPFPFEPQYVKGYGYVPPKMTVGDVNADGLSDIMAIYDKQILCDRVHGVPIYCPKKVLVTGISLGNGSYEFEHQLAGWKWSKPASRGPYAVDLNGDGKSDLISLDGSDIDGHYYYDKFQIAITQPNGKFLLHEQRIPTPLESSLVRFSLGDANGDGRTDLFIITPHDTGSARRPCDEDFGYQHVLLTRVYAMGIGIFDLPNAWDSCEESKQVNLRFDPSTLTIEDTRTADVNGDGLADFLGGYWADGYMHLVEDFSHRTGLDTFNWSPAEINGDGKSDLVYVSHKSRSAIQVYTALQESGDYTIVSHNYPGPESLNNRNWMHVDVGSPNGKSDGRTDLVYVEFYDYENKNKTSQRGIRVHTLLSNGDGTWTPIERKAWPGFTARDTHHWMPMDINGDGLVDLVHVSYLKPGILVHTLLSKGDGTWAPPIERNPAPGAGNLEIYNWKPADVNKDGKADLIHISYSNSNQELLIHTLLSNGDGSWIENTQQPWRYIPTPDVRNWRPMDVNGDGLTDLVHLYYVNSGISVHTLLATGSGNWIKKEAPNSWVAPSSDNPSLWRDTINWWPADVNGDGRTDLVHVSRLDSGAVRIDTLMSKGDGFWVAKLPQTLHGLRAPNLSWKLTDANGDSKTDLIRVDYEKPKIHVTLLSNYALPDLVTEISNGMGGKITINYELSSTWQAKNPKQGCHLPVGVSFNMVRSVLASWSGSPSERETQQYSYKCPRWSYKERQFLSWEDITVTRPGTANKPMSVTWTRYKTYEVGIVQLVETQIRDYYRKILTKKLIVYPPIGSVPPYHSLAAGFFDYQCSDPYSDPCVSRHVDITYDEFGNNVMTIEYGGSTPGGVLRTTRRDFHVAQEAYIVGLPRYEYVYEGFDFTQLPKRAMKYCYDGPGSCGRVPTKGLLTATELQSDQDFQPSSWTYYEYDSYGNQTKITDANLHTTTITYDSTFHLYPTTFCNALNQCSSLDWDYTLGQIRQATNANGQLVASDYDALGRLTSTSYPNGGILNRQYLDLGNPNLQRIREWTNDGSADGLWTESYMDGLGRTYRVVNEGNTAGVTFAQDTIYGDTSSQVYKQSHWYQSGQVAPVYETFKYDAANRLVRQIHPDGTDLTWIYNNDENKTWANMSDEQGHEKTVYSDANGRILQVQETNKGQPAYTTYEYNALDQLTKITDNSGNVITMTWDSLGRKLSMKDPDLGYWTYTYDKVGNLITQTDARGVVITYTYDALDRLKTKQSNLLDSQTTVWNYDEPGHGASIGMLTSISDPTGSSCTNGLSEELIYDVMGQVSSKKKCILGSSYEMHFGYDLLGRPLSVTYPDGEVVTYRYDAAGQLQSMSNYVDSLSYNAAGQLIGTKFPNQTQETFTYDPKREWLEETVVSLGPNLLYQASYQFEPNGLVKSSSSTTNKMNLAFAYDDLHRLIAVTGDISQTFQYDPLGNMTFNSKIGQYDYLDPKHIHAVTQAGQESYEYDDNGNMISDADHSYTWDQDNLLVRISGSTGISTCRSDALLWTGFFLMSILAAVTYGKYYQSNSFPKQLKQPRSKSYEVAPQDKVQIGDGETRLKQAQGENYQVGPVVLLIALVAIGYLATHVFQDVIIMYDAYGNRVSKTQSNCTTRYFSSLLELDSNGNLIKYYYAGSNLIARQDASGTFWYHQDHLGSTRLMTNQAGAGVARYDYRLFGEKENSSGAVTTDIQFTGHRSDEENGLIYMNARYYDPQLARFISADSVIPNIQNPQALNRYSYVNNNPVSFTDPTGHQSECVNICEFEGDVIEVESSPIEPVWIANFSEVEEGEDAVVRPTKWVTIQANISSETGVTYGTQHVDTVLAMGKIVTTAGQAVGTFRFAESLRSIVKFGVEGSVKIGNKLFNRGTLQVTKEGIQAIEAHLTKLDARSHPPNAMMIERLRSGNIGEHELNFYIHELKEAELMGFGLDARSAHLRTLEWQGIPFEPGYERNLFHPDVIFSNSEAFSPAAHPALHY